MIWKDRVCFDVLSEGGGNVEPPRIIAEPGRPKKITCEFCECELGASGEYKKLSDKAKLYRDAEETIERLQSELVSLRADLTAARQATPAPVTDARASGARHGISL
jgi:hypothetical protein